MRKSKLIAAGLAAVMLLSGAMPVQAVTLKELKQQRSLATEQLEEIKGAINTLEDQKETVLGEIDALDEQLIMTLVNIDLLEEDIADTEEALKMKRRGTNVKKNWD